ncbi:hypothetical protein [Motilimonas eburnea]|uniref:hypothetical protein n=1 Tax=Motilimonas eburnea TaxID=1737488 RepID=UPI001E516FF8|nr:hypothetical protein [Motilimonas eburnea]MCE2571670.1 hypothetical protein [Motilimonas eburnea]
MWYLISGHAVPKFYNSDGEVISVDLDYAHQKTIAYVNEEGALIKTNYAGKCILDDIWMIAFPEKAVQALAAAGIYPYQTKTIARARAKALGLVGFKYVQVPPIAVTTQQ